ncbi:MAG TPA: hypothetical protein DCZ94_00410 [Lentisphaeria bacterium]|nr:MAG: hypothetical protein A2X48_18905 [Lentisphaerae bacterium GWF2_49_21]HBC85393.1 hypothetical protein [Lentisphaeria bacterium]
MKGFGRAIMTGAAVMLLGTMVSQAATLSVDEKGIKIPTGGASSFILGFPELRGDGDKIFMTNDKKVVGKHVKMKFEGGAEAVVAVDKDKISVKFEKLPAEAKHFRMTMQINFDFAMSAKWKAGDRELVAFPPEKPSSPHLYQGNTTNFELAGTAGKMKMTVPAYSYIQLTDCREWNNWKNFTFFFNAPIMKEATEYNITIN